MKKVVIAMALAASLGGLTACNTPQDRAVGGALLGGAAGAAIGGAATGRAGGALLGGAIGAGTGAIIGAGTAQPAPAERCYYSRYYGRTVCETY